MCKTEKKLIKNQHLYNACSVTWGGGGGEGGGYSVLGDDQYCGEIF